MYVKQIINEYLCPIMQRCCKYSRNSAMYKAVQMKKYVENIHVAFVQNIPVIFVLPSN